MQKYTSYIINVYEDVKKANRTTYENENKIDDQSQVIEIEPNYDDVVDTGDDEINTQIDDMPKVPTTAPVIKTTTDLKKKLINEEFHYLLDNTSLIPYTPFKYKDILFKKIHDEFTGFDLINMLPKGNLPNHDLVYKSIEACNYSLKLGKLLNISRFLFNLKT